MALGRPQPCPAHSTSPTAPSHEGLPWGGHCRPWGTMAGTARAVGGHEASVAARAAASAHGCQHNARPRLTAPFVSPLGSRGRTKQSAPSALPAAWPGARPGGPCGDARRGGTRPDRPCGAQHGPGGPLLREGHCPDGGRWGLWGSSPSLGAAGWGWRWDGCHWGSL